MQLPQECPECGADLRDGSVPPEFEQYRNLFSLVLHVGDDYVCPVCQHRWEKPKEPSRRMKRQAARRIGRIARRAR